MRITTRNAHTLPVGEHRDDLVPGLILRVWATGAAWSFRYTFNGVRSRVDLGPLERDRERLGANIDSRRDIARGLITGLVRGEDPRDALRRHAAGALTVAGLCAKALEALPLKDSTRKDWQNHLKRNIEPRLSGPAAALSRATIRAWGADIAQRGGYEANRAFEVLRRCYSWGVETEILESTPFVRLPLPWGGETIRRRVLSPEELGRLMAQLDADDCGFADGVWLLLLTGVRKGSVDALRLADVAGDTWTIPDTKNSLPHVVPLSRQAVAAIDRQKARIPSRSVYLFPRLRPDSRAKRKHSVIQSSYTDRLKDAVGGEPWKIHDLRTTIATHLEDALSVDLRVVSLILGHVPKNVPESTRAYALGQRLADRREALQRWADWLETLPRGPKAAQN